jgi:hypothetical protein
MPAKTMGECRTFCKKTNNRFHLTQEAEAASQLTVVDKIGVVQLATQSAARSAGWLQL